MTVPTDEEIRRKIRKRKDRVDQVKEERPWKEKPSRAPAAYGDIALDARHVALYSVILGEFEQAREWFSIAADHYQASGVSRFEVDVDTLSELKNAPYQFVFGFYMAVFAGDDPAIQDIAQAVFEMEREHPYELQDGSTTTIELDAEDCSHARYLAAAAVDGATHDKDRLWSAIEEYSREDVPDSVARMARFSKGILAGDPRQVVNAISDELASHEQQLPGEPEIDEDLICVEATAMSVIARRSGLDVDVDSQFIPTDYIDWLLTEIQE